MEKNANEICLGDVRLKKENLMLVFNIYYDYSGEGDVKAEYYNIMPGHSYHGPLSHMRYRDTKNEEWIFKDFLNPYDAKKLRLAYYEYKNNVSKLYKLYASSLRVKEITPLYYVDDTHLNVDLKENDILVSVTEDKLIFLELQDTEYRKNENAIPQEEDFYQWLTETDKTYAVKLYGTCFTIDKEKNILHGIKKSSKDFNFSYKKTNVYLVKGITLDWLYDRIISITKKFYDTLYEVYTVNFESFPYENIKHINGKIYSEWNIGKDILDCDNEIKRTEYVVGE